MSADIKAAVQRLENILTGWARFMPADAVKGLAQIQDSLQENLQRAFACTDARGVYLSAVCVVFAADEDAARALLLTELQAQGLGENFRDTVTLREIPMIGAHVLWNGDY